MLGKHSLSLIVAIIFSSTIIFQNCASKNKISNSKVFFETIYFGKSGGFTNLMEKYALKESGSVYKIIEGEEKEINSIEYSKILEIDHKLNTLDFKTISLEEVGNMTYFIEVNSNDYSNKITWTDLTDNLGIKDLYKTLISTFQNP